MNFRFLTKFLRSRFLTHPVH